MNDGVQPEKKTHIEYTITTASTSKRANGDDFGRAISKIAVAQICESVGFESFNESALESLADVAVRYLRDLGKVAKSNANLSNRIESNVFDIIHGLEDLGFGMGFSGAFDVNHCTMSSGVVKEVIEYVESSEEIPFAQPVPNFPVVKASESSSSSIPSFIQMGETPETSHIPPWLPAFPDPHTYKSTPVWNERVSDPKDDQIELARQRRKGEKSFLTLQQRLNGSVGTGGSGGSGSSEPDPKLPESENPFLINPKKAGEEGVSLVVPPVKLTGVLDRSEKGLLETFAPAIEAMQDAIYESGCDLPEKRKAVSLKFKTGKRVLGEPLDLRLREKGSSQTGAWFGRDDEGNNDKKRRAEFILRQSIENQHDLT